MWCLKKRRQAPSATAARSILGRDDTLVVTRLDRLGRSLKDLADISHEIEKAGANLKVLEQPVDTSTSAGRAFFGMLAVFAAFETDIRRERQAEGIVKAKRAGVYSGGVRRIDRAQVRALQETGSGPSAIASKLGISRRQVYRILAEEPSDRGRTWERPKLGT
jgi:DNA invertase Pin-like site-specific DNA recombinase